MKKLSFFALFGAAVLMVACKGNSGEASQRADAKIDSLMVVEALEKEEVEEMENVINSLSACLDSIQVQENLLFKTSRMLQSSRCWSACVPSRPC